MPRRSVYKWTGPNVMNLDPSVDWHVYYFDPATGKRFDQFMIKAGDKSASPVEFKKNVPSPQDWVLVFEKVDWRSLNVAIHSRSNSTFDRYRERFDRVAVQDSVRSQLPGENVDREEPNNNFRLSPNADDTVYLEGSCVRITE